MTKITGDDLIAAGYTAGPHFKQMLITANKAGRIDKEVLDKMAPAPVVVKPLEDGKPLSVYAYPETDEEFANMDASRNSLHEVLRTPNTIRGALMPDACPAGPHGTIPVGGVVASTRIHPGMHSADVCCSVFRTCHRGSAEEVFNRYRSITHFGGGGRKDDKFPLPKDLIERIKGNSFTKKHLDAAKEHFGTQGDGNHFGVVGKLGPYTQLVTHHGSRGFGAGVFKDAMKIAEQHTSIVSPDTLKQNSWLPEDIESEYWDALMIIQEWTRLNHSAIHAMSRSSPTLVFNSIRGTFTPHNFVFRKWAVPHLYYHAKGATPLWTSGVKMIPLNMRDGILVVTSHPDSPNGSMGFGPHGAGRNLSRTKFRNSGIKVDSGSTEAHFFSGHADVTEMPQAYKDAESIVNSIKRDNLATVMDVIKPKYSLMAGLQPWEVARMKKKGTL